MPRIVISYRRSDSSAVAGRIFDRLSAHYGEGSIFMDIDSIPIGTDFRTHIRETLLRTDVLIAVIGANWLGVNASGVARLQEPTDPVRVEIETALENKVPIIPVLVDGAKMPNSTELPPAFGNFAYLNAAEVVTGRDFRTQIARLIGAIDQAATGIASVSTASSQMSATPDAVADIEPSSRKGWANDVLRCFVTPLVLLLVAHHVIVNALNLDTAYLQAAAVLVPFVFGFLLFWLGRRPVEAAIAFAITLGIVGAAGMTVSQSLNSGDPILPQTRFEWWDNINFATIIALSFFVGHLLAGATRTVLLRPPRKL
jgi:hypothetical protein